MKHTLKLLLCLLPLFGFGQQGTITFTLPKDVIRESRLNAKLDSFAKTLKEPVIVVPPVVVPEVPGLKECKEGPLVSRISNVTPTSLLLTFHGNGVTKLQVTILDFAGRQVREQTFDPLSNQLAVTYTPLPAGRYKLILKGLSCNGQDSEEFDIPDSSVGVIPPVVPEIPALNPCKEGPQVSSISNVTSASLLLKFHGDGVTKLQVTIFDLTDKQVHTQTFDPKSNQLSVTYSPLPAGKYRLMAKGLNCQGEDSEDFTIADSGVGVVVPPVVAPPVQSSNVTTIAKGFDGHMQLDWKKDSEGYLVSDLVTSGIGNDYEFRYQIGSDIVKTGHNALKNYRVAGFNPVRVIKYKIKPDKVLNQWEDKEGPYYDVNTGEGFSYNTSIPYQTYAFPGASGDFVNPIPANYNPALQNVQWGDIAPDIQLPKGHVYVADPRPWGIEFALKKGVTHFSNFALPWDDHAEVIRLRDRSITYTDIRRIEHILGVSQSGNSGLTWDSGVSKDWWPEWGDDSTMHKYGNVRKPGYAEGYAMGLKADITHAFFLGEWTENISWIPPSAELVRGFYDGFVPRMKELHGDKAIIAHDYMLLGMPTIQVGRVQSKKLLITSPENLPRTNYSPGGSLSKTNLILETVYLGAPDIVIAQPYELIFKLNLYKHMGYQSGVVLAPIHEWRPNNMLEIPYPEGKFFAHAKVPIEPNTNLTNGFVAQVFGNVYVEWGGNIKTPDKLIHKHWYTGSLLWFPNGSDSPQSGFPYYKETDGYPTYYGYNGSSDLGHFSQVLFSDTYGPVEGGTDKYLRFRIDGGAWVDAQNEDYIDAYHDKRGFVHSRTLNGKTAFFYLNCFTDNKTHDLEVELPNGPKWSGKVAGNGIHAKLL